MGRKISLYQWASPHILSGSISFVLSFVFKYNVIPHELHLKKKSFTAVGCCAQPCLLFGGPWTVALQMPLPKEFSRQECWSGVPFPPPGDLLNPGSEPALPVSPVSLGRFLPLVPPGKLLKQMYWKNKNRDFSKLQNKEITC